MLYEVNDDCKKWRILYSGSENARVNKESKDVELLLRMCAFRYYVKQNAAEFILTEYKGKISVLLDDFSEKAILYNDKEIEDYKNALLLFFDSIEGVTGKNKELALVSMFVVWDKMEPRPYISKNKYEEIINNKDYCSTIQSGTSKRAEIEKRLRSVYELLSKHD